MALMPVAMGAGSWYAERCDRGRTASIDATGVQRYPTLDTVYEMSNGALGHPFVSSNGTLYVAAYDWSEGRTSTLIQWNGTGDAVIIEGSMVMALDLDGDPVAMVQRGDSMYLEHMFDDELTYEMQGYELYSLVPTRNGYVFMENTLEGTTMVSISSSGAVRWTQTFGSSEAPSDYFAMTDGGDIVLTVNTYGSDAITSNLLVLHDNGETSVDVSLGDHIAAPYTAPVIGSDGTVYLTTYTGEVVEESGYVTVAPTAMHVSALYPDGRFKYTVDFVHDGGYPILGRLSVDDSGRVLVVAEHWEYDDPDDISVVRSHYVGDPELWSFSAGGRYRWHTGLSLEGDVFYDIGPMTDSMGGVYVPVGDTVTMYRSWGEQVWSTSVNGVVRSAAMMPDGRIALIVLTADDASEYYTTSLVVINQGSMDVEWTLTWMGIAAMLVVPLALVAIWGRRK